MSLERECSEFLQGARGAQECARCAKCLLAPVSARIVGSEGAAVSRRDDGDASFWRRHSHEIDGFGEGQSCEIRAVGGEEHETVAADHPGDEAAGRRAGQHFLVRPRSRTAIQVRPPSSDRSMVPPARTRHRLFGSGDTTVGVDTCFCNCLTAPTLGAAGDASRMRSRSCRGVAMRRRPRGGGRLDGLAHLRRARLFSSRLPCCVLPWLAELIASEARSVLASDLRRIRAASASLAFASFADAGTLRRELAKRLRRRR